MIGHGVDSRGQRLFLGGLGIIAAAILVAVSMALNWRFGFGLGKTETDGYIYAFASLAADIFKFGSPFFFIDALRRHGPKWKDRNWGVAAAALLIWVISGGYASVGAIGHASMNRLSTAGARTLEATNYKDLRADLKRHQDQLSWIPPHRPASTVKADLEGVKGQFLWTKTGECADPAGKSAREFCQRYHALTAELGSANDAAKLNDKIDDINKKLTGTKTEAVITDSDPQASSLATLFHVTKETVNSGLALFVVLLIEVGSSFGPYAAFNYAFGSTRRWDVIDADYKEVPHSPPGQPHVQAQSDGQKAVPLIAQSEPKPRVNETASVQAPATVLRARLPGSDDALKAIGIPFTGDRKGPLLDPLPSKEAAEALVSWIRAHDLARDDLSSEQINTYDAECCKERHRKQTLERDLKDAMVRLRGVEKGRPQQPDGSRPVRYSIKAGRFPKPANTPQAAAPEPAQKQEGGRLLAFGRRPLAVAPERAHMTAKTTDRTAHGDETEKRRQIRRAA